MKFKDQIIQTINDKEFNIVEVEKEVIRKSKVMLEEKNIKVEWQNTDEINVLADDFYIEQVLTNYLTNAIKNVEEMYGEKYIKKCMESLISQTLKEIEIICVDDGSVDLFGKRNREFAFSASGWAGEDQYHCKTAPISFNKGRTSSWAER